MQPLEEKLAHLTPTSPTALRIMHNACRIPHVRNPSLIVLPVDFGLGYDRYDHDKDVCTSEVGPLRVQALWKID